MLVTIVASIACFIVGGILSYVLFKYGLKAKYDNVLKEAETEAEVIKKNKQCRITNRRTMKYQAENTVSSFFYYMWNAWSEEECKTVYGGMYPHFWEKWCVATDKGTFGAAERFYLELSEDNRRLLVERAVSIYDGRGLRNRNRNIKNQTACRETLSV